MLSTKIVNEYLNLISIQNTWVDVANHIKTCSSYREDRRVDLERIANHIRTVEKKLFYITQGFLRSDPNFFTTNLGREGSDLYDGHFYLLFGCGVVDHLERYSGCIEYGFTLLFGCKAFEQYSYEEAIELLYYGGTLFIRKFYSLLQEKGILLYVRNFLPTLEPDKTGYCSDSWDRYKAALSLLYRE
ncbi:MAG: hypothetical protein ACMUEL_02225 [Flavobacteriales bacterium Tduv]